MILYRPVGLDELELIYDSGMKAFPARLPQQPIFYPVLDLEYARQIASDWNIKSGQSAGYVTQFKVEDEYIGGFEEHTVGGSQHRELWIPAEELEEFNQHIVGHIKVVEAHFGDAFEGFVPEGFALQGKNAVEQFTLLANSYLYKRMDFFLEIRRNHKAVFLNYPFWLTYEFKNQGLKEKIIKAIKEAWLTSFPQIPLPSPLPLHEDTPAAKQTDLDDPVEEEFTPEEDNDAQEDRHAKRLANPVPKKVTPVKQSYADSLINPVREKITPEEQTDSSSWWNPDEENSTTEEQTDAKAQVHAKQLVNPVHEDTTFPAQTDAHGHFDQGIKLGLSGMYSEAIDELSKSVEEDPDHVVTHTSLGVAFHRLGEDDRALACYETALRIEPICAEAYYFRANILYDHGNVREAIAGYTIAIGLKPELIEAHQNPIPQDRLTDYNPAPAEMVWIAKPAHRILDLNRSLESDPQQANRFKERAAEYYRLRNFAQAIADYSSCLELQPDDANALHSRGVAYEQLGQNDRALEDYQRALAINPQLSNEYIQRGIELGKTGNFRQSITSLTEAIRLAPKNPNTYFNRGMSYFQLGDFEKAIEDFSNVIWLSPGDEAAYYWRGISNEEAGRQGEAIADYKKFLELSQDADAREEIEQRLRQWEEGSRDDHNITRDMLLAKLGRWVSRLGGVSDNRQKTDQIPSPSENPEQALDLYDLIAALGDRALHSTWFGSEVNCYGENAEELYAFTDQTRPIEGHDFLRIAAGIQQTIAGDFQALDLGAATPWIFIRAWEGSGFYIETDDAQIVQQLKTHFPSVEDVDGATPPYAGLFIRS
jgi:tetratricopeptide (TPR) repeat protein